MIGSFPEWGETEIEDKAAFAEFATREPPVTSELSFENLYVWRLSHNLKLTVLDGALCALASPEGQSPFLLPPIAAEDAGGVVLRLFDHLSRQGVEPTLQRTPEGFARRLTAGLASRTPAFRIEPDRDNFDYVYLGADLINLGGRKYHRKRNQIAQFKSRHTYEYRRITPDLLPLCVELQTAWCDMRDCFIPENAGLAEENQAVLEALQNYEGLDLVGGAILVDGRVEAFTIGGELNRDTFVIHFEKGNPRIPGIYQVVNQEFCADACRGYKFVNREQDLGDPGLRQAKMSYYPHHMIEKYTISLDPARTLDSLDSFDSSNNREDKCTT
ncbi:MAG: phosphatidylglycerol lysyltransferase domain-containing protein [Armatimonadota bacterium]|nr:phosphatidylglycerol lysyltransferase domain-containing protein [Armatimonadota bacterium]